MRPYLTRIVVSPSCDQVKCPRQMIWRREISYGTRSFGLNGSPTASETKSAWFYSLCARSRRGISFTSPATERNATRPSPTCCNAAGRSEAHARAANTGAARSGVRIQLHEARARPRPRRHRTIPRPNARRTKPVSDQAEPVGLAHHRCRYDEDFSDDCAFAHSRARTTNTTDTKG
jgi:hypothetical protein